VVIFLQTVIERCRINKMGI